MKLMGIGFTRIFMAQDFDTRVESRPSTFCLDNDIPKLLPIMGIAVLGTNLKQE